MTRRGKLHSLAFFGTANIFAQLTIVFFVITFALKAFTDGIFVTLNMKGAITDSKYLTMGGVIFFGICYMASQKSYMTFWRETKQLLFVFLTFLMLTCALILYRGEFATWQIRDLLNLLTPILFAYVSLNVMNFSQLLSGMKVTLIMSFIGYLIQLALRGVSWADVWQSSFTESTSPLESNDFAALAIALCFFFCFYRSSQFYTILSVVFAVATFKRLAIIFAIIAFLLPTICNMNKKLPKSSGFVFKLLFFALAMTYFYLLTTAASTIVVFGKNLNELTMGRANFLQTLLSNGYQSFGYGSVEATRGASIEMCLVRISLELSPLATFLFINNYWNLTRNNRYCALIMTFHLLNLTTADSISSMFGWAVTYITIGLINMGHRQEEHFVRIARNA